MKSVYSAVRTDSLYTADYAWSLEEKANAVCLQTAPRPLPKPVFDISAIQCFLLQFPATFPFFTITQ